MNAHQYEVKTMIETFLSSLTTNPPVFLIIGKSVATIC
ncbi:hypothetical protein KP78_25600 [Jeotgalibacillus soli]|uniref:Uncharacterized protein n=1 Tax=Jeotgalibacillus soli TaxID=889306 RepID=A0A0C2VKR0_9BACL|nr:hypothetical protein KP78_25600 [Jeotgalibacillus soli]